MALYKVKVTHTLIPTLLLLLSLSTLSLPSQSHNFHVTLSPPPPASMNGGGGDLPLPPQPSNGGEFLLSLIQRPHHSHPHPRQQSPAIDPAVAVVGPTIPVGAPQWPIAGADHPHPLPLPHQFPPWSHTLSSPLYPPNFFGLPHNPFPPPRTHFPVTPNSLTNGVNVNAGLTHDLRKLGFPIEEKSNKVDGFVQQQELKLQFGSLPTVAYSASEVSPNVDSLLNLKFNRGYNGLDRNLHVDHPTLNSSGNVVLQANHDVVDRERRGLEGYTASGSLSHEASRVPPGFGNRNRGKGLEGRKDGRVGGGEMGGGGRIENLYGKREGVRMVSGERSNVRGNVAREMGLVDQLDRPGPPAGSNLHSSVVNETGGSGAHVDVLGEQLADSLLVEDDSDPRQRRATREKVHSYICW